ncbi:Integrator complex subunit 3, partial [Ophiophagus hannah]
PPPFSRHPPPIFLPVFSQPPILQSLQHVQCSCDEAHKMKNPGEDPPPTSFSSPAPKRFSDLFSLAEEYEDSSSKLPKSRRKAALSSPRNQ